MKFVFHLQFLRKMFSISMLLCFCLGASGCGNTCYVGVWDGSGAVLGVSNNSCSLDKANGAAAVHLATRSLSSSNPSTSTSSSPRAIQHIFVTLRAVQASATAEEAETASGWQDLAPDLVAHPVQIDLLAPGENEPNPSPLEYVLPPAIVSAEEYRQIRFRLLSTETLPADGIPETNRCGNAGWNCIVFNDGSLWAFGADESEFRFLPASSDGILFRVLPDALTSVSFHFDSESSAAFRSTETVRLVSVFKVSFDFRVSHE
jgi:hypothetical protein